MKMHRRVRDKRTAAIPMARRAEKLPKEPTKDHPQPKGPEGT